MAINPIVVIGCGGSGGKVVLGLRRRLEEELRRIGWTDGIPEGIQLKWVDVPTEQEQHSEFGDPLSANDYLPLAPEQASSYRLIDQQLVVGKNEDNLSRLIGWRPPPSLSLPIQKGAGKMRAVGRAVAITRSRVIQQFVMDAVNSAAADTSTMSRLATALGSDDAQVASAPVVFVVSSMAGGTGAGIFMDVCDLIRSVKPEVGPTMFGVLFTAEIFPGGGEGLASNTLGALGELLNGYYSTERTPDALYASSSTAGSAGRSGPTYPFLVGASPLNGGAPLQDPIQVYRVVTDTLFTAIVDTKFAQDFIGYQITNFLPGADAKYRATNFEMFNQPRADGEPSACGVVSAIGSSSISVGAARFQEWARDRLARASLDHIAGGWKEYGRQLMGGQLTASTTDQDVVRFLVDRERLAFFDACGLWEEDEPNGKGHDQVIDGIATSEALKSQLSSVRATIRSELNDAGTQGAAQWQHLILNLVDNRKVNALRLVDSLLAEGFETYAESLIPRIEGALSSSLAQYGHPVASGLLDALTHQCKAAREQLLNDASSYDQRSQQSAASHVIEAFRALGQGSASGDSEFVNDATRQAIGPLWYSSLAKRSTSGAILLERVMQRVLKPMSDALATVGGELSASSKASDDIDIKGWPDQSGGVSLVYQPSASEFVVFPHTEWNAKYKHLLQTVAGSEDNARAQVCAGGFEYGPMTDRNRAPQMFEIDPTRWWDENARFVTPHFRITPRDLRDRSDTWTSDENHAFGQFVSLGLREYLTEQSEELPRRIARFEDAISQAVERAQPLINLEPTLMQLFHRETHKEVRLTVAPFPFGSEDAKLRAIVEKYLPQEMASDQFLDGNLNGVESVVLTSVLEHAVHPAAVASVAGPIASSWSKVRSSDAGQLSSQIRSFWTLNRARLISECIPLTKSATEAVMRGFLLGRMLGIVTDPEKRSPLRVLKTDVHPGGDLPWPLLRHGKNDLIHEPEMRIEWLPALLEHLPVAMLYLGKDSTALDGYEALFQIGKNARSFLRSWVIEGEAPSSECKPQLIGDDAKSRIEDMEAYLAEVGAQYRDKLRHPVLPEHDRMQALPYGIEVYPLFIEQLGEIQSALATIDPRVGPRG